MTPSFGRRDRRHASWGNGVSRRSPLLVSPLPSFDFFLLPLWSFRISRQADTTTEVLFVAVGLLSAICCPGPAAPNGRPTVAGANSIGFTISLNGSRVGRIRTSF